MCGRFAMTLPSKKVMAQFNIKEEVDLAPRYNIAPTQQVAVVRSRELMRNELVMMRWGLIPYWAKDKKIGYKMINARGETIEEKPTFRSLFKKSRCLIPADGFYEWKEIPGEKIKQPYFIQLKGEHLFAFAGLWSSWQDPASGETIDTCTIITTAANKLLAKIHDRMPVIIQQEQYGLWLATEDRGSGAKQQIKPYDPFKMTCHPVSGMCNNPKYDTPACIKRAADR